MSPPIESTPKINPVAPAVPTSPSERTEESPRQRHREPFRMLLSVLKDPERAYTLSEEIMSAAGENVVAQVGARVDILSARIDGLSARINALAESTNARIDALAESTNARIDALAESTNARIDTLATLVASMNARMERLENQQSRQFWGVLGLQTALVVAIITLLLRG